MLKIKPLGPRELKQVLDLLHQHADHAHEVAVLEQLKQLYVPLHQVSHILPPQMQFVPAIYVAANDNEVLGLIRLSQDGKTSKRWKLDHVIIDPNTPTYDVGAQLVNYVINRYGGSGVQTFLAHVDQYEEKALGLMKACSFRRCTRIHAYTHPNPNDALMPEQTIKGLRQSVPNDAKKLKRLFSECLPADKRMTLEKSSRDYTRTMLESMYGKLKGVHSNRWVIEDLARDILVGSAKLYTPNYKEFYFDIFVSPGWRDYYEDLLNLLLRQALQCTQQATVYITAYDFNKDDNEILINRGFSHQNSTEVLVKDYWIPLQDREKEKNPLLLFGSQTSPAMNMDS